MAKKQNKDLPGEMDQNNNASGRGRNSRPTTRNGKSNRETGKGNRGTQKYKGNDPAWYTKYKTLANDAGSIFFNWSQGLPISSGSAIINEFYIPGFQILYTAPSIGWTDSPDSPINVAADALYVYQTKMKSGSKQYDAPDTMIFCLAISEVYSYIVFLQRLYKIATTEVAANRYLPKAMVEAQCVNYEMIVSNLADFRWYINVLINKVAALAVPSAIDLFKRKAFLYQDVYTEGTSMRDQMYMYAPAGFWKFTENNPVVSDYAGSLIYEQFADLGNITSGQQILYTPQQLFDYGLSLINPLVNSQIISNMSADITAAFGGNIVTLQPFGDALGISPVFDIGVLEQMKNADVVPYVLSLDVTQDDTKGFLMHTPYLDMGIKTDNSYARQMSRYLREQHYAMNRILSTTTGNVTVDLIYESSRLKVGAKTNQQTEVTIPVNGTDQVHVVAPLISGTEIPMACYAFTYSGTGVNKVLTGEAAASEVLLNLTTADGSLNNMVEIMKETTTQLNAFSNFRFHPSIDWYIGITPTPIPSVFTTDNLVYGGKQWDIDNFAIFSIDRLEKLHTTAIMSLLNVPTMGSFA